MTKSDIKGLSSTRNLTTYGKSTILHNHFPMRLNIKSSIPLFKKYLNKEQRYRQLWLDSL